MPIATILALAEQYGPTVIALLEQYGPTIADLIRSKGPAFIESVWPLIVSSFEDGRLVQDVEQVVGQITALAPALGHLGDLAAVLGSVGGAPVDSPAMEHAAGHGMIQS